MAEAQTEKKETKSSHPSFLEVTCKTSGKTLRFAQGTDVKFALHAINNKIESAVDRAISIVAVKKGEDHVMFGPTSTLVDYGHGWKLETVIAKSGQEDATPTAKQTPTTEKDPKKPNNEVTVSYLVSYLSRILLAFAFMFVLAGSLSYFLVVLPDYLEWLSKYWDEYVGQPIMSA